MAETLSVVVSGLRPHHDQPALYIGLFADAPVTPPARIGLAGIDRVEIRRSDVRSVALARVDGVPTVELGLPDARLSHHHARLSRRGTTWAFDDLGSKNGSWIRNRRIKSHPLGDGDVVIIGHTALVYRSTGGDATTLTAAPPGAAPGLRTMSPALDARFSDLAVAARGTVAIEITGETGTGKELIAHAIHALSGRPGEFVAVNCGALASSLLEGELFGHRRGAYTGAAAERPGLIRSADQGTLFLDEIAELPSAAQASLLRVLQEKELTPLGADRPVRVDLRARLLGFRVELPPLRERPEDLGLLVAELLERNPGLHPSGSSIALLVDAVAALYAYHWPMNVRELERALAAATSIARERIELSHLPPALRSALGDQQVVDEAALSPADRELRARLVDSIARHAGNLTEVARELAKDRTQIRRWMKRLGLRREPQRGDAGET